ncbi:hypothetical protein TWF696_000155 [Orbilia brochopaga]|uniref:Uncharacterized protein n=1 Tax=Orbilia brochopaga TaxID=3140254 RepID=A0AAV9VD64_9PEZI
MSYQDHGMIPTEGSQYPEPVSGQRYGSRSPSVPPPPSSTPGLEVQTQDHNRYNYQSPAPTVSTSPVPPYVSPTSTYMRPDPPYVPAHEKPVGGPPIVAPYGPGPNMNGQNMAVYGMPPTPAKTICGLRRKTFFILVVVIVVLLIAGLGAGLGVALSQKNQSSSVLLTSDTTSSTSSVPGIGAGSGPTTSPSDGPGGGTIIGGSPPGPPVTSTTSGYSTPGPITIETTTSTTPFEATSTSTEPTTSPEQTTTISTTPFETTPTTTSFEYLTTTLTTTRTTTPRTTTPRTTTPRTTTPRSTTPTTTSSVFELETGYNTLTLTAASTTGILCAYLLANIAATTTVYASIDGSPNADYTAYWGLDNYPGTFTATGQPPEPTDSSVFWYFEASTNSNIDGCVTSGKDSFLLNDDGVSAYGS